MEILFDNKPATKPAVSLVLLDWSVRESFHILQYLQNQNMPRDHFQVIWIEYYGRRAKEIEEGIKRAAEEGVASPVDTWVVMDVSKTAYYHKHLMYNVGIVLSRGRIVSILDSDSMANSRFVETIIKTFDENQNIVLHIDQLRNCNRKFYPFSYPTVEEIEREGPTSALGEKPFGLVCTMDPIHSLNYGGCMCALHDDLIAIGGADEHIDYLGYICGPYDMTLRLANAGKREIWHQSEWLYHTWHPGQSGTGNYVGPSDGRNISSTALDVRRTGRVLPLRENPAIRRLRLEPECSLSPEAVLELALSEVDVEEWDHERLDKSFVPDVEGPGDLYYMRKTMVWHPVKYLRLAMPFFSIFLRELRGHGGVFKTLPLIKGLWQKTWEYRGYVMERGRRCLREIEAAGIKEIAIYGTGAIAKFFCILASEFSLEIAAIYDEDTERKFNTMEVLPVEALRDFRGKLVVAKNVHVNDDTVKKIRNAGIKAEDIVLPL